MITTDMWAERFAEWMCIDRANYTDYMKKVKGIPTSQTQKVVVGWLQQSIDPLLWGWALPPMRALDCGNLEPNATTDLGGGPTFLDSYYGMVLTMQVSGRTDTSSNCYATDADAGTPAWCERRSKLSADEQSKEIIAMNVDNDRLVSPRWDDAFWKRPCAVPVSLRKRVIAIADNFSVAIIDAIISREIHISPEDVRYLQGKTSLSELYLKNLSLLFQACT